MIFIIDKGFLLSLSKKLIKLLLLMLALTASPGLHAQICNPEVIPSEKAIESGLIDKQMPIYTTSRFNKEELLLKDEAKSDLPAPFKFGENIDVNIDVLRFSKKQLLPTGESLYRFRIYAPGALSLNFGFSSFQLPAKGKLFIYTSDKKNVLGAITDVNNNKHNSLGTMVLPGESVVIEYIEPAKTPTETSLIINRITYGYRPFEALTKSGSCNNNVSCPEAEGFEDQINAVCMLLVNGNSFCSGALINNTAQDQTPYVLTANHCSSGNDFSNWVFWFNYQSSSCDDNTSNQPYQSISGSTLKARNSGSDFCLVEMSQVPPAEYNVFYAGWSRENMSLSQVGIHHPSGDIKKISFDNDAATAVSWQNADCFQVYWDDGTTEHGSSGSPLFNHNKLIIGQLYGGYASCSNMSASDNYGRFNTSWDAGSSSSTRLKEWLDPVNLDPDNFQGFDPNAFDTLTAGFHAQDTIVEIGDTVFFSNQSGTPSGTIITQYQWTFEGGIPNSSEELNPNVIYPDTGLFDVGLKVYNNNNDSAFLLIEDYIRVNPLDWCSASSENQDETITEVSYGDVLNPSTFDSGYADYSHLCDTIKQADTLVVSVNASPIYPNDVLTVFVDFNKDYDFNDIGESISYTYTGLNPLPMQYSFIVPGNATIGKTRMRVRLAYNENPGACGTTEYGEVEDYSIYIEPAQKEPISLFSASDTVVCPAEIIFFENESHYAPDSLLWSVEPVAGIEFISGTNAGSENPQIVFNNPGYYSISLITSNSYGTDTLIKTNHIHVMDFPEVNAGSDTAICYNDTAFLSADGNGAFLWNIGSENQEISVVPLYDTHYVVTVTAACGLASDSVLVTVIENPVPVVSEDTAICENTNTQITAVGGTAYLWNTGDTTNNVNVSPDQSTNYQVTVFNQYGCKSEADILIDLIDAPNINIQGDTGACPGNTVFLYAPGHEDYQWSTGQTESYIELNVSQSTYIYLTVTGGMCDAVDSVFIYSYPIPEIEVSNDTTVCSGDTISLFAQGAEYYYWNTGESGSIITIAPEQSTTYIVNASNSFNCYAYEGVNIETIPYLQVNTEISASPPGLLCTGDSVIISSGQQIDNNSTTFLWIKNNEEIAQTNQPLFSFIPEQDAEYSCYILPQYTCLTKDTFETNKLSFNIFDEIETSINIESDKNEICIGETINFSAESNTTGANPTYLWRINNQYASGSMDLPTYSTNSLLPGDTVQCLLVSSLTCAYNNPGVSNSINNIVNDNQADFYYEQEGLEVQFTNLVSGNNDFLWEFGDGAASSLSNPIHLYPDTGVYQVRLSIFNNCAEHDTVKQIRIDFNSIKNLSQHEFFLYPNPVIDFVYFSKSLTSEAAIKNAQGRVIKILPTGVKKLNTQHLPSGIYLIEINNIHHKIIKI